MHARAKVLRDNGILILRYAVIFGGVVFLLLLITNVQKTIPAQHSSSSALAQISP
jgi:hypothetical protein